MGISWNEISSKSNGGSELMARRIEESLSKDLLDNFQIIISRVRELDETKLRVLILNDLVGDPESEHLKDGGWRKFHKIVFVSHWQKEFYVRHFQIPYSRIVVIKNAILPISIPIEKPSDKINLIYHSTPQRGLDILYSVVAKLAEAHKDIHLDVYSSFEIYGWGVRDAEYKDLFGAIKTHPNMTYHGYKPNDEVRAALTKAHIFSFPSTWSETSCISLMEAMSAECACVHPDLGALPETAANWTLMYPFHEDKNKHAAIFYQALKTQIEMIKEPALKLKLSSAKGYADLFYNWNIRKKEWEQVLTQLLDMPREFEKPQEIFHYRSA